MAAVVKADKVAEALQRLRSRWAHPHFAGYLCLKRVAAAEGRTNDLQPDFKSFYDTYLRVPGADSGYPYLKPFVEGGPTDSVWLNKNVAGSLAPSSLRPPTEKRATLLSVVSVDRTTRLYSFLDQHWRKALEHLLRNVRLSAVDVAAVFYRDFGIVKDNPSVTDLVTMFRQEFGYTEHRADNEFTELFDDNSPSLKSSDWLEAL